MHARRLIAAPLIALVATMFVGAVIDSGQRARMTRAAGPVPLAVPEDPVRTVEAGRIQSAIEAGARCTGAASCTPEASAARVRGTAVELGTWAYDRRFQHVRASLQAQLLAQANVFDLRAAIAVDGRTSTTERARHQFLERRLDDATLEAARAQRAAGLISRAAYDAIVDELR